MEEDGGRRELICPLLEAAPCSTRKTSTWPSCAAGFLCHPPPRPLILCGSRPIPQRRHTRERERCTGDHRRRWMGRR
jgi:hypothetical protein